MGLVDSQFGTTVIAKFWTSLLFYYLYFRRIFKLSPEEWLELENQSKCKGELLYLSSGKEKSEKSSNFEAFCDWFPAMNLCQFYCLCRPFKKSKNEASNIQKLYCIDILSTNEK